MAEERERESAGVWGRGGRSRVGRAAPAAFVGECGQRRWLQAAVASCRNHGCGSGGSLHSSHLTRTRSASTRRSAAGSCRVGARSHGKRASSDFRLLTRERARRSSEVRKETMGGRRGRGRFTRDASLRILPYLGLLLKSQPWIFGMDTHATPFSSGWSWEFSPVTFYFNFFSVANLAHVRIIA